ncbi:hypothetical protein IP88_03435 [alpha proteobacterium AAP81b]|nr:hypothetical protein IP88_03435 [alpha proteobacterium AAP81b]
MESIVNAKVEPATPRRAFRLLAGASVVALVASVAAVPALAQLARLRAAAGVGITPATVAAAAARPPGAGIVRPATRAEALARAQALRTRSDTLRSYIVNARNASLAAIGPQPGNGLVANGLSPIQAIRDAIAAGATSVPAGLTADRDASGVATWQNVNLPTQTTEGGRVVVGLVQTSSRAIASWDRFDIGANTTLRVTQKVGAVDQPGWTLLNRVANNVAPSTILGRIEAPGTVVVLNRAGVAFGQGSQINVGSLLASSLEIGAYLTASVNRVPTLASLAERNATFLQNGLFSGFDPARSEPTIQPMLFSPQFSLDGSALPPEGAITVDRGASITAAAGGQIIFAAPNVVNNGLLFASDGQVSLQGGRYIGITNSTGADDSADRDVRGYILTSFRPLDPAQSLTGGIVPPAASFDDGAIVNAGLIQSLRGYVSLGTTERGSVANNGLIEATTSVSRNAKVALYGGTVTFGGVRNDSGVLLGGGIRILPDGNGETLPQGSPGADSTFKTSQISISSFATSRLAKDDSGVSGQLPTIVDFQQGSFIEAPGATVRIGRDVDSDLAANRLFPSSITLGADVVIDVSGSKGELFVTEDGVRRAVGVDESGIAVDGDRNFLTITPVTRNELRDTPTYREVAVDGNFTLNASTLTVDIRNSGVRSDGVRWVGSPLLEAGSAAAQIAVTAAELLSTGGSVTLGVVPVTSLLPVNIADQAPSVRIATTATIDISGGWLNYSASSKGTSKLRTADGRVVDIRDADRNDNFVAIVDGFVSEQPRFGLRDVFNSPLTPSVVGEPGYTEGRDAGALIINAAAADVGGKIFGNAFAGRVQIANGSRGTTVSSRALDPRRLQTNRTDLPNGGYVRISPFATASEAQTPSAAAIVVYRGARTAIAPGTSELPETNPNTDAGFWLRDILLDGDMLSAAGLSALTLESTGGISFAGAGDLAGLPITATGDAALGLAPGGNLTLSAGRSILFNGTVVSAGGVISATTRRGFSPGQNPSIDALDATGSPFDSADDLLLAYAPDAVLPSRTFDIVVNGSLSTAGLWTNSLTDTDVAGGRAFLDGGSISLTVAPKALVAQIGSNVATDLSGRIEIASAARIDVSAGGYVATDERFDLSGRGGNVSLINRTVYASLIRNQPQTALGTELGDEPIDGANQSVDFDRTGLPNDLTPMIMPAVRRAAVLFDESSLIGFGFTGGGRFELVSPDIRFNEAPAANASNVSLDFLQKTGFGTLALTTTRSRFFNDLFTNARDGVSAFLDTTTFRIRSGQTLDLTQVELPRFLNQGQSDLLLGLTSGSDVVAALRPTVDGGVFVAPTAVFDQTAAKLEFGGLTELVVDTGATISTRAPGAEIDVTKLLVRRAGTGLRDDGTIGTIANIRLPGGKIVQREQLFPLTPGAQLRGVRATENDNGLSAVFGTPVAGGQFDLQAPIAGGPSIQTLLTVIDDRVVFAGALDLDEAVRLEAGSITDLSGGPAIYNPRAPINVNGQLRQGILPDGGSLSTAPADPNAGVFQRRFTAEAGALLDLSGSAGVFDQAASGNQQIATTVLSNGGTLSILGGGTLRRGVVRAGGGVAPASPGANAPVAIGGTLEWLRPTLAPDATDGSLLGNNVLASGAIGDAGFDTLITRGGFTVSGALDLRLDKALLITSGPRLSEVGSATVAPGLAQIGVAQQIVISGAAGANATISAPFIRSESLIGYAVTNTASLGDASLRLEAGNNGLDVAGAVLFDRSLANVRLGSARDIRLIGVNDIFVPGQIAALNGEILGFGNLTFDAVRVYATTGTGNLQRNLENFQVRPNELAALPYQITALPTDVVGAAATAPSITFLGRQGDRSVPLSAGSYLRVQARTIIQNGALYAPLGVLELGSIDSAPVFLGVTPFVAGNNVARTVATSALTFGAGSLTSVSAVGAKIPYGTTSDLRELFFAPTGTADLSVLPFGQLRLAGRDITFGGTTARIDGRGTDDPLALFAFEFVSGVGGSRDVLSRINTDAFSSNNFDPATGQGQQYADGRQVFALLPVAAAGNLAFSDPIYSADYGSAGPVDLYGAAAGRTVRLDAAPGFAGGEYLLLPGHYALLPGALRLVENVDALAPAADQAQTLRDGSFVVGGTYATAGTSFNEAQRHSFTVQNAATFGSYSRIAVTGGSAAITAAATAANRATPRLPLDAARVTLAPLISLTGTGFFDTAAATGGRGSEVDISGQGIVIAPNGTPARTDALVLTPSVLAGLNANSLFIGGERRDNLDGTTALRITATDLTVSSGVTFEAPEILLAVDAPTVTSVPTLRIEDGATIRASGVLSGARTTNFVIETGDSGINTGIGAVVRVADGPERLLVRRGAPAAANSTRQANLIIGSATLRGDAVLVDSSRTLTIEPNTVLAGQFLALGADNLRIGEFYNSDAQLANFAAAERLTLTSSDRIRISGGDYRFRNLVLDGPGLALQTSPPAQAAGDSETVTIAADSVSLRNSSGIARPCGVAALACASSANRLFVNAGEIVFGDGDFGTFGFDGTVALAASRGAYYEGVGSFDTDATFLTLSTPFLIDRANAGRSSQAAVDFALLTDNQIDINRLGAIAGATPTGERAPGARLQLGNADRPLRALVVDGTAVTATAGVIAATVSGDIVVRNAAQLLATGYTKTFGDNLDGYTVSASGGTISLVSTRGNIRLTSGTRVDVDNGIGNAGTLRFLAGRGAVELNGALNSATGVRTGSLILEAARNSFDLAGFVTARGAGFQGRIDIRTGLGDLTLADNQRLRATSVRLVADGGAVNIAGTIDTSGTNIATAGPNGTRLSDDAARQANPDGGNIELFGETGVTLAGDARLDTHTTGYAADEVRARTFNGVTLGGDTRTATAGDVTIGIGSDAARIVISADAAIDLGARRAGNRLVAELTKTASLTDEVVYRFVEADKGGALLLRAPVIGATGNAVGIELPETSVVTGARSLTVEGVRTYDLDNLAGRYAGVSLDPDSNSIQLNLATGYNNGGSTGSNALANSFTDGSFQSVAYFVQNFRIAAASGSLADFDARPGVELVSTRAVNLATNWNLAAADINIAGILAAQQAPGAVQLLRPEPALTANSGARYSVVPGSEAALLESSFTRFVYRVDGLATGAAPVLTIRSAGDFTNRGRLGNQSTGSSISDGFFLFTDFTDQAFVSARLGGAGAAGAPRAPFSVAGNRPAAQGTVTTNNAGVVLAEVGDPLGSAALFPLLAGGSQTMASSSYRIVAGAALASADPLQVDRGRPADLAIGGERTYNVDRTTGANGLPNAGTALNDAYVGAVVRTGTGSIALAASRDVNLLRTAAPVYRSLSRQADLTSVQQVGSSAVYTAGARIVTTTRLTAATFGGGTPISFDWDALVPTAAPFDTATYVPRRSGQYLLDPVLAAGGGDVDIVAQRDIVGRRDAANEFYLSRDVPIEQADRVGETGQAWRVGQSRGAIVAAALPHFFRSGVGTLAGGDTTVVAGRDVTELTVVANNVAVNADERSTALLKPQAVGGVTPRVLASFGDGDVVVRAGNDVAGGQIDVASGRGTITADGAVVGDDVFAGVGRTTTVAADLRVRLTDATVAVSGRGSVTLDSVTSLGADARSGLASTLSTGDISAASGLKVLTAGFINFTARQISSFDALNAAVPVDIGTTLLTTYYDPLTPGGTYQVTRGLVSPGSLELVALGGDIDFSNAAGGRSIFMLPSRLGQLRLLADGDINRLSLAMSDADPGLLQGNFSAYAAPDALLAGSVSTDRFGVEFGFPATWPGLAENRLRNFHNERPTHADNPDPVFIAAEGSLRRAVLNLPKQARIRAGGDISNFYFTGQNLAASDVTRIVAGRDIVGTLALDVGIVGALPYVAGNNFVVGGPGSLVVEAGRNLGPFLSSGRLGDPNQSFAGGSYAGGIRTVGNELNPWLGSDGASIIVGFGIGGGADYAALREAYLNPGNFDNLDGDLFVQYVDTLGNRRPLNRTNVEALIAAGGGPVTIELLDSSGRLVQATLDTPAVLPVRAATLAQWLQVNAPAAYEAAVAGASPGVSFTGPQLSDPQAAAAQQAEIRFALAAGLRAGALYNAFVDPAVVSPLQQQSFLASDLLFAELREPALTNSASSQQFIRGYRALQTLFPTSRGYTDNLAEALYETDPATITTDNPQGVPRRRLDANGQPVVADRKLTGDADLRLSTLQTARGGSLTILAPGGDLIAGSVVRLSEQLSRRYGLGRSASEFGLFVPPTLPSIGFGGVDSFPRGFEGLLTLRSGDLRGFFDGDFRLNQSRAFTFAGGNINFWSSNGDLNAGQGPRTAASFPPITVRFNNDGVGEVNSIGSVSGAGIGTFKRNPEDADSEIVLVAPVGEVDAGDAGVRASGNIFVAAARVANAAGFSAGGSISGVPTGVGVAAPGLPTGANSTQQAAQQAAQIGNAGDRRSVINVDVLGAVDPCSVDPRDPNCVRPPTNP